MWRSPTRRNSLAGVVNRLLVGIGVCLQQGKNVLSFSDLPGPIWSLTSLLLNGHRGPFRHQKCCRNVKLTSHLYLVQISRMHGAIPPLNNMPSGLDFSIITRTASPCSRMRKARRAIANLVAQIFSCPDGEHCFIRERAHWRTVNFSVAATGNLQPIVAWLILEATEMLLIKIGRTCFSLYARTGN
jgi:hypothetical protein